MNNNYVCLKRNINILIIGFGPHAQKTYAREFERLKVEKGRNNIKLCGIVDLDEKRTDVYRYLNKLTVAKGFTFIAAPNRIFGTDYFLTNEFSKRLTVFCNEQDINAVFIATEPICHYAYIEWALNNRLHIFLDKPVTLHVNSSTEERQAQKIIDDYLKILALHKKTKILPLNKPVIFSCLAQRRYHPAFLEMRRNIQNVYNKTNCPVTSITALHSDGQWRFPYELLNESYHGFNEGVGKVSHSGYHLLDIVPWLIKVAERKDQKINKVRIFANFVRPKDIVQQLPEKDIERIFGQHLKEKHTPLNKRKLLLDLNNYGEVDAYTNISFMHDNNKITDVNFTFLHSGFTGRTWVDTKDDPFINRGRLKQEVIVLYQGPFFSTHYHCCRAGTKDDFYHYQTGGVLHTEAHYYFNSEVLNLKIPRLQMVSYHTSDPPYTLQETSRATCVYEFIEAVETFDYKNTELFSPFEEHKPSVLLMAGIYIAASKELVGKIPYYEMDFSL